MKPHSGWYVQQAKANPDLFRVVYDFNCRPQFWLHSAVTEELPHAVVVRALAGAAHGGSHLAAWLSKTLGLGAQEAVWDFQEPRRRLALLSPESLLKLARFAGAALCWPRLSSVIGRTEIQEIKAAIGEDAYSFALRRARLLVAQKDALVPQSGEPLMPQVIEAGWSLVATAASDDADSVQQRLMLKLPPSVAKKTVRPVDPDLRARAWSLIRKISPAVFTEGESKCFA